MVTAFFWDTTNKFRRHLIVNVRTWFQFWVPCHSHLCAPVFECDLRESQRNQYCILSYCHISPLSSDLCIFLKTMTTIMSTEIFHPVRLLEALPTLQASPSLMYPLRRPCLSKNSWTTMTWTSRVVMSTRWVKKWSTIAVETSRNPIGLLARPVLHSLLVLQPARC